MSQLSQLEEGNTERPSSELSDGVVDHWKNSVSKIKDIIVDVLLVVVGFTVLGILILINYAVREKAFLLLCVIAIILDPLFFYIPVMNDEKKCIELDNKLGIIATVLRSVIDFFRIIHIFWEMRTKLKKKRKKRLWLLFFIDILAILPIPQVLVIFGIRGTEFMFAMTFFLLQYLIKVIRTYFVFTQATGVSGILAHVTRAIVAFNLLLYMHGGLVFGALWYFYAIKKASACWKKACTNHTGCGHNSFDCDDSIRDYNFLNDFCSIKTGNTTNYNFGIFNDALQSGTVEETYFPKKFLHCLQWGLQNLSAFGQNLQTSTDMWENLFAICMTNYGVVLFVFLIAKMQSDTARSQRIRLKLEEIDQCLHCNNLSSAVRTQIREHKRHKWQEIRRLDIVNLVDDLPEDIGRKIKCEIGLNLLSKVLTPVEDCTDKLLEDICSRLKPVSFVERTYIIRKGEPIHEMLFVIKGKLWTYPSARGPGTKNYLEDGDFCGEELIAWAKNEPPSSNLPISPRNIQAVTKVDAFAFLANDLKRSVPFFYERNDQAARIIQSCWRGRRQRRSLHRGVKLKLTLTERLWLKLKLALDRLSEDRK